MHRTYFTLIAAFCFRVTSLIAAVALLMHGAAAETPNVIVIMADDLGYGDLSCYGATELETPHIDKLAGDGLRFTNGYCSASTCTPTRYSLLTGTYAFRVNGQESHLECSGHHSASTEPCHQF